GVNVFPSQIENILMDVEGVAPHYQIVVRRRDFLDELEVRVELEPEKFTGQFRDLAALEEGVRRRLYAHLGLGVRVRLLEPGSLERSTGKARRLIDERAKGDAK
ncbi:MAG: phenylacetate--CoA ligase, partial [Firmicutes bacterium]|nr:phenylacetate--CoA ligase [Bacillota bacterium]